MHIVKFTMYDGKARITDEFKHKDQAEHYARFLKNIGYEATIEEVLNG